MKHRRPEVLEDRVKEIPRYRCHKEVQAFKIDCIDQPRDVSIQGGTWRLMPAPYTGLDSVEVTHAWVLKHNPQPGGYYVRYADGYESFSPAEAFESGYVLIQPGDDDAMRRAVVFLNENFSPWTFNGSEPVSIALADLLRGAPPAVTRYPCGATATGPVPLPSTCPEHGAACHKPDYPEGKSGQL